jgi:hypothetical protein
MVKVISDSNFKIVQVEYDRNGFNSIIETIVLTTRIGKAEDNIGNILEKYRMLNNNLDTYFESKREILENYICIHTTPFNNFLPDGIICIYPLDYNRRKLLEKFKEKLTSDFEKIADIDYSENFFKKDKTKSIKKDNLTGLDFELTISKTKPFKGLLIIDDVFNEGKTLEILLNKLLSNGLINNDTTIKFGCIYNLPISDNSFIANLKEYKEELIRERKIKDL